MASASRIGGRLSTSARSGSREGLATLNAGLADGHPPFLAAVRADAEVTARYRSEHHNFRSPWVGLLQAARLAWITDSFFAQICVRAKVACRKAGVPLLPTVFHHMAIVFGQINVGDFVVLSPGIYIPHGNVVIDGVTRIEEGVAIRPYVTIGLADANVVGPAIEAHAKIGTGAKVIGAVVVGARSNIGANAVVVSDIPPDTSAVGMPARPV